MPRRLQPATGALRGEFAVPGDKSISHRIALMAPLAGGVCRARGWLDCDDTRRSLAAVCTLGAEVREAQARGELAIASGSFPEPLAVVGGDPAPVDEPVRIACGNSGTTARLLLGLLAGRRVTAILDGDSSLRRRPLERVVDPLRALGARIDYLVEPGRLPVRLEGRSLRGGKVRLPVVSAQVKSALLLAGLGAGGSLCLNGCGHTRDHTERLLGLMGVSVQHASEDADDLLVAPATRLAPFDAQVPGDISSAAFLLAAALLVPGSRVTVTDVLLNPGRIGFLHVLRRMGADFVIRPAAPSVAGWEPRGDVTVSHGPLQACRIAADEVPALVDELPILAVLATRAAGVSEVCGAAELRIKESDRIATMTAGLRRLGVEVAELLDGWRIAGPQRLRPEPKTVIRTAGDHRVAMAFAVAALAAEREFAIDDAACMAVSYPGFLDALAELQRGRRA